MQNTDWLRGGNNRLVWKADIYATILPNVHANVKGKTILFRIPIQTKQQEAQERQLQFQGARVELERSCIKKLLHLQEMARRNETDSEYASKVANLKYEEISGKYQALQEEQIQSKVVILNLERELDTLRTIALPSDEAAQLLQEMVI